MGDPEALAVLGDALRQDVDVVETAPVQVFVYGTLMPGDCRWRHLSRFALSWQPATAAGRLWDTGHGYPGARFGDGDDPGAGEIPGFVVLLAADLVEQATAVLDQVEGEGVLYRRVEISTSRGQAMSYEWLGRTDGLRPLPDGWHPPP